MGGNLSLEFILCCDENTCFGVLLFEDLLVGFGVLSTLEAKISNSNDGQNGEARSANKIPFNNNRALLDDDKSWLGYSVAFQSIHHFFIYCSVGIL